MPSLSDNISDLSSSLPRDHKTSLSIVMSYHIHQKDPESYSNSNEPWARTDLPTSTPVGGFDTSAYPYDHSLLSADAALWSTPEFMMPPFFPDGGKLTASLALLTTAADSQ